jgi:hypothetical protein
MLAVQTPYLGGAANGALNKLFFDVALRNMALILLCITIERMALEREEGLTPFWERDTAT